MMNEEVLSQCLGDEDDLLAEDKGKAAGAITTHNRPVL